LTPPGQKIKVKDKGMGMTLLPTETTYLLHDATIAASCREFKDGREIKGG